MHLTLTYQILHMGAENTRSPHYQYTIYKTHIAAVDQDESRDWLTVVGRKEGSRGKENTCQYSIHREFIRIY